jgi:conjugative relaxase-like TrwC/TraI family protein
VHKSRPLRPVGTGLAFKHHDRGNRVSRQPCLSLAISCLQFCMLRITQQVSPDAAKQYFATADYYTEGQELLGRWGGKAAEKLGLQGQVSGKAFNLLCDNLNPTTGKSLTARTRGDRTVGYDFTWSVPKSVSVLYAMTEDPEILNAFRESVCETMDDIQSEMKARIRKGGRNAERVTGNAVYGEFVHFTSRPVNGRVDPQLHAHCFMLNATFDGEENRWKAGQFRDLKREAPYFQAAFRARLANRLQGLGLPIERKKDDFEILGMPARVIKEFSQRTAKIEELAETRGITNPKEKDKLGGKSREKKDKNLTWQELKTEWKTRLKPGEQNAIDEIEAKRGTHGRPTKEDVHAVDFAIKHLFERDTVVSENRTGQARSTDRRTGWPEGDDDPGDHGSRREDREIRISRTRQVQTAGRQRPDSAT